MWIGERQKWGTFSLYLFGSKDASRGEGMEVYMCADVYHI